MTARIHRPSRTIATLAAGALLLLGSASAATADVITTHMIPTAGATNKAALTLTLFQPLTSETIVQPGSTLDFSYDTGTHNLVLTDGHLTGSDASWAFGIGLVEAKNIEVEYTAGLPGNPIPQAIVNPVTGAFSNMVVNGFVSGQVYLSGDLIIDQPYATAITLSGTLTADTSGAVKVTNVTGVIPPIEIFDPFTLSGSITLNFSDSTVVVNEIPAAQQVGTPISLAGHGFTPGSLLKVFVATSSGTVDVIPNGLNATSVAADGFTWNGTLPWPWPVGGASATLLGNGYASVFLVRPEKGFDSSNAQGVVLLGNPNLPEPVPSITGINGTPLSATSSQESIATANVEDVMAPAGSTTIEGFGFVNPVVNVFSASGNCAPPGGIVPSASNSTSLTMTLPAQCPIGPGSVQVINASGTFLGSNAVSIPIGELVTISSIQVNGGTVTVNGSGFNSLTVINLFAGTINGLINAGGLNPNGTPKVPLDIVDSHQFTFARPGGLLAGAAFVQAINPPFIPFTNSGTLNGGFVLP